MIKQSSYIYLSNLRFRAYHGVLPQERVEGNDFIVNIRLAYDFDKAMETDDVADTLSYADVYQVIKREMQQPSNLLEHVVGRIGKRLLAEFPLITAVDLKLTKVNPPMGADCDGAGVEIHLINDKTD